MSNVWTQPSASEASALLKYTAATLGMGSLPMARDVTTPTAELRVVKDAGEIDSADQGLDSPDCRAARDDEGGEAGRD